MNIVFVRKNEMYIPNLIALTVKRQDESKGVAVIPTGPLEDMVASWIDRTGFNSGLSGLGIRSISELLERYAKKNRKAKYEYIRTGAVAKDYIDKLLASLSMDGIDDVELIGDDWEEEISEEEMDGWFRSLVA